MVLLGWVASQPGAVASIDGGPDDPSETSDVASADRALRRVPDV